MDKLPYEYYTYPWEWETDMNGEVTGRVYRREPLPEGEYESYVDLLVLFFEE